MEDIEIIKHKALDFIKSIKRELINELASIALYQPADKPISLFMAGAPGVGKTELAERLSHVLASEEGIKQLLKKEHSIVRIAHLDPDKIRLKIPGYTGANSELFQRAISKGMSILFDYCQEKKISYIVDGTFSNEEIAMENVKRAVEKKRSVLICFLYRDPLEAWKTVLSREITEGRRVPKEAFVEAYFESIRVVNSVKQAYTENVNIWFIRRDQIDGQRKSYKIELNVDRIDGYLPIDYPKDKLHDLLPDSIL